MKRLIRVSIKIVTAPVVALFQTALLFTGVWFILWEDLNEHKDSVYSYRDLLQDYKRNFVQYWRGILL